jgi:glutathione S-transferase
MSEDLVFYTNPTSRGRIVRWMLEEIGQPYTTEIMSYDTGLKAPAYLAINPMGKVPALRHGDVVVTECATICTNLADAFPQCGLAPPPGDRLRGPYYRWLFFGAGPLECAVTNQALQVVVPQGRARAVGYGSFTAVMDVLEQTVLKGDYLVGGKFSAADLYLASQFGFGMQFGMVEKRAAFEKYVGTLARRPAAVRAVEIDDALISR